MIMGREVTSFCFFVLGLVIACPSNPGTADQSKCGEGRFLCSSDQICIDKTWVCDGTPDCNDGSDETTPECKGTNQTEGPNQTEDCTDKFMCKWGTPKCIDKSKVCDGKIDCTDTTDEKRKDCMPENLDCEVKNNVDVVVQRYKLCDGFEDCEDNSDEPKDCFTACYDKKCYHLGKSAMDVANASQYCEKLNGPNGGYLVEITDQQEQDLIWNFLQKMFIEKNRHSHGWKDELGTIHAWIGLSTNTDIDIYDVNYIIYHNYDTTWEWTHSKTELGYDNFEDPSYRQPHINGYGLYFDAMLTGGRLYNVKEATSYDGYGGWQLINPDDPSHVQIAWPLCEWEL